MYIRIIGAVLIVAGCGGVGLSMGIAHMHTYRSLKQLILALENMICDIQYRLMPLPDLCRSAARQTEGKLQKLFLTLSAELEDRLTGDVFQCMCNAISKTEGFHPLILAYLRRLGRSLGRFDLEGQVMQLESVREDCRKSLKELEDNKAYRLRSYQTLSICAGVALAVLLL